MAKIFVQEKEISAIRVEDKDYISLTDMANAKKSESRAAVILSRIGFAIDLRYNFWEHGNWIHNPDLK